MGENKTPITGKAYLHSTTSPKVHTKRSPNLRHACASCTFAENTPQLRFHFRGQSEAGCSEFCSLEALDDPWLTMTATNVSCGIVRWRRAATRGSTVCLFHALPSFLLLTKRSLLVNAAKSTLGDTDDDIGSESSAKSCLRTLARRLKLCWEYSWLSNTPCSYCRFAILSWFLADGVHARREAT